ncbi:MAG: efflux RND transporter periplasmic adaptor subunit [Prochlorotrichaceae cyanobacterium]
MLKDRKSTVAFWLLWSGLLFPLTSCQWEQRSNAQPQSSGAERPQKQPPIVELSQVTAASLSNGSSYTGTTQPKRTVSLRSRVEGQLLTLSVDVGDRVEQGQVLAQLDDEILRTAVNEAQAELAARRFEVEQGKAQVAEAEAQVESARAEVQQAQIDADRFQQLATEGALATQDSDLAQTNLQTAKQTFKALQQQVKTRQQSIASLGQRVQAQNAILQQAQERLKYATLTAPINGTVLSRVADPGDLIQPGETIVDIGDLEQMQVHIQVSDRDLSQFRLGQAVEVSIDAFPTEIFEGTVTQISPVADAAARLVPLEVTIANPQGNISSGLMARVHLSNSETSRIKVPESAIRLAQNPDEIVIFVPTNADAEPTVEARSVEIGQTENGQVEILSGLTLGETFVVKSDRPLEDGEPVRRSFLSE